MIIKRFNLDDSADDLLDANMGGGNEPTPPSNPNPNPDTTDNKDKDKQDPEDEGKSPDINKGGDNTDDSSNESLKEFSTNLKTILTPLNEADLTEDDKAVREDLLEEFKGSRFNENGDILDANGKVVKTFDEVAKYLNNQEDIDYDKDGNKVDKDGNIIATKEEIEAANNDINKKAKRWGYTFVDENNKPKVYPKGEEGEKALIEDIVNYKSEEFQKEFFNSNPVLREVAKHLYAGGDIKDFQTPIDYSTVDIKSLTKEQKINYIGKSLIAEGVNPERANKIAATYKDSELDGEAKAALDILQTKEVEKNKERERTLLQQEQQAEEENAKYWEGINEVISKGDLKGFAIPEADKKSFFNYLAIPVKDGKSQDQLDRENNPIEVSLKEAFYRYKGYDLSKIVKENVSSTRAADIKRRIQKREELASNKSNNKDSRKVDVSLDNIQ
jgi:hypothetical protein